MRSLMNGSRSAFRVSRSPIRYLITKWNQPTILEEDVSGFKLIESLQPKERETRNAKRETTNEKQQTNSY